MQREAHEPTNSDLKTRRQEKQRPSQMIPHASSSKKKLRQSTSRGLKKLAVPVHDCASVSTGVCMLLRVCVCVCVPLCA